MFSTTLTPHKQLFTAFAVIFFFSLNFKVKCSGDYEGELCTMESYQKCLKMLSVTSGDNDLALPVTENELENACSDLKNGVRCLDSHIQQCFTPEMHQVFNNVATNAKSFVKDLCDNHTVQREYLRHAKCFRNVSVDEHKCGDIYRSAVSIALEVEGKDLRTIDKDRIMKKSCCALQEFVQCKHTHVGISCGERAVHFMQKQLPRITNPIMDEHCSAYTYGPDACTKHDSQKSNAIDSRHITLELIITLILLKFIQNID